MVIHFEIPVGDMSRAKHFYGELFGWTFADRPPGPDEGHAYSLIETGGRPNGALMGRVTPGQPVLLYFNVEDLEGYVERAQGLGALVRIPRRSVPGLGWWAAMEDPEGNVFALWQDDPGAA